MQEIQAELAESPSPKTSRTDLVKRFINNEVTTPSLPPDHETAMKIPPSAHPRAQPLRNRFRISQRPGSPAEITPLVNQGRNGDSIQPWEAAFALKNLLAEGAGSLSRLLFGKGFLLIARSQMRSSGNGREATVKRGRAWRGLGSVGRSSFGRSAWGSRRTHLAQRRPTTTSAISSCLSQSL